MDLLSERPGLQSRATRREIGAPRFRRPRRLLIIGCVVAGIVGLGGWLWDDLTGQPAVYVVGDSITSLSQAAISAGLIQAGYRPTISATPGAKIGQAVTNVATLAEHPPWAWVIQLGTDDAGARNGSWPQPFLAEWAEISPAACVIYVTVSPRAGPIATQIDSSMERLAEAHANVHVLDWGQVEYENPTWVSPDGIHPTSAGQSELAGLEVRDLLRVC